MIRYDFKPKSIDSEKEGILGNGFIWVYYNRSEMVTLSYVFEFLLKSEFQIDTRLNTERKLTLISDVSILILNNARVRT